MQTYFGWGPVSLLLSVAILVGGIISGGDDIEASGLQIIFISFISFLLASIGLFRESGFKKRTSLISIILNIITIFVFLIIIGGAMMA